MPRQHDRSGGYYTHQPNNGVNQMNFPVTIKDGKSTITFTSNDHGTYESGAACMSTLEDMMVRVEAGSATIVSSESGNVHNTNNAHSSTTES